MNKRIMALLLALLLALANGAALADGGWTCPSCGADNTGNFCTECGAARPWACPSCGADNTGNFCTECGAARPWACPSCGADNTGNFCTECGAARPNGAASVQAAASAPAVPAAAITGEALDEAFAIGRATFIPAELPLPDFSACELVVPDAFWQFIGADPMGEAEMRQLLASGTLTPVSISPDGTRMAAYLEAAGGAVPLAISPNRVAVISPTADRGVEDTYGNLAHTYSRFYLEKNSMTPMNMGAEGMIWSPDGRYFCSISHTTLMQTMKFDFGNPAIVDTETGEMFLLDTYPSSIKDSAAGCIFTGCFSRDGKSFYAIYYGKGYDTLCTPLRYDLENGERETWGAGMDAYPWPSLAELADGSLLAVCTQQSQSTPMFLAALAPGLETRRGISPVNQRFWLTRQAEYAAESGWHIGRGAFLYGALGGEISALQRLRPDESLEEGLNRIWAISAKTRAPEALSLNWLVAIANLGGKAALEGLAERYLPIGLAALSPDGRYAAVLAGRAAEPFMLIVRLEDMTAVNVEGIPLSDQAMLRPGVTSGVFWSDAGLLIRDGEATALWTVG